ncbi:tripartite tricarboxylate transporter TctB family protein [Ensifer adhaerens]|uniref:tripartite tricarboxylate transporter TctB family protein n=1 Tax=Ensifer adhaerens TaxID=106592 RepID=UPI001CC07FB3|nr:tripartite tricarboxylate transporter TctB family protein [Ensifer adhaerens]MBZ7926687.1 tripartite tricarboxylate transporter TctB family protein [Ensifer adhaerens]UAX96987.1 tripartite tricarboxylate transporter TctB family protein [Ensifer adhaerens]UAY03667.1 tripartite tricarboxylate transporter TctB family protein [Ensifer adhaerens]UAY11651.1 tripartite tricarboxylate transporter TctB family protein [Ensifer adhaerens]
MSENGANGVSRFAVELGVAALTGAFGVAVCYGSLDIGAGWTEFGPEAGYFPFYVGLLILLGSVANAIHAFVKHRGTGEIFIDSHRAKVVSSFLLPLIAFAGVSAWLGLYVGTALYIAGTMFFQGRYKWWIALPSGVAVSLFFFVVFEIGFKVPLLKGPVEAWFGIY